MPVAALVKAALTLPTALGFLLPIQSNPSQSFSHQYLWDEATDLRRKPSWNRGGSRKSLLKMYQPLAVFLAELSSSCFGTTGRCHTTVWEWEAKPYSWRQKFCHCMLWLVKLCSLFLTCTSLTQNVLGPWNSTKKTLFKQYDLFQWSVTKTLKSLKSQLLSLQSLLALSRLSMEI